MARRKRERRRRKRGQVLRSAPIPAEVRAQIEDLLEEDRPKDALEVIETWLEKRPDNADLCFYAGCAHGSLENFLRALTYYRRSYRRDQRNEATLCNLIPVYVQTGFLTHALRVLKRYLRTEMALEEGDTGHLTELRVHLENYQREAAGYFDVGVADYEEAHFWDEEAQICQQEGNWDGAIAATNKALGILPDHPPALNNRAMSYYYGGHIDEAVADEERVLAMDLRNVHALSNLTRFYYVRDERQKMLGCFERLKALSPTDWEHQAEPIVKMLEAYAVAGTDEEVYAFLKQYVDEVPARGYYMLGASAANLGKLREARRVWEKVVDDGAGWEGMAEQALEALDAGKSGLGRAPRFPYTAMHELVTRKQIERLAEASSETRGEEQERRRTIDEMTAQHPGLLEAARWFLWHGDDLTPALSMLALLGTERAWAEVRTFALGQIGTDQERTEAIHLLRDRNMISDNEPIRVWLRGEWKDILLKRFEVTDEPGDLPYSEEAADLLGQGVEAIHEENLDEAERIYLRILDLEPNCYEACNNLAQIASRRGDTDTVRRYLERSLEINPDYLVGRCNLANIHLIDGQMDRVQELIRPLIDRTQLAPFELKAYYLLQARIQIVLGDVETAGNLIAAVQEWYPDHPEVEDLTKRLNALRPIGKLFEWVKENTRRKRERDDARLLDEDTSLESCLNRHIRENLYGMALRLGASRVSGYRKGELIGLVAELLRDADALQMMLSRLPEKAREALDSVLAQGGVVPWAAFNDRYGNDMEDTYYGPHSEPKTAMGQLRMTGIVYMGVVAGERKVMVPTELRSRLREFSR